jgi:hypothetical protein
LKENYIRVSELLNPWKAWGTIPQQVIDTKAIIGTNVHEAINAHISGFPIQDLEPREKLYYESYLRWEEKHEPSYALTEQRYYNEGLMLTGQIDAILSDGTIIDYKTSSIVLHKHWAVQLGWYYLLAQHNGIEVNPRAFMLQLRENKEAVEHVYDITPELIHICKATYDAYMFFKGDSK